MALMTADEVYDQVVKGLPAPERLRLVEKIVHELSMDGTSQRRRWREIRGLVAYPMCGEDAQDWVSRGRREADEERAKQWGKQP
jgi:hypothetical protein